MSDTSLARFEPSNTASSQDKKPMRGKLGTAAIVFSIVGFMAPLYAAAGYIPLTIGFGNGLGAPLTLLVAGAAMLIFAVGLIALVRHIPRPGGFYSYVAASLGRPLGLGTSGLAFSLYGFSLLTTWSFFGLQAQPFLKGLLGLDVPWWLYAVVGLAVISYLCVRGIELSIKVLSTVVIIEVTALVVFNLTTLTKGGPDGFIPEVFSVDSLFSGSFGLAMLFAITLFIGVEGTVIYREEARDPSKSIPRATYIVIIGVSVFYAITTLFMIVATGHDSSGLAAEDPSAFFNSAVVSVLGKTVGDIVVLFTLTSTIACAISLQNVGGRYLYSLGRDRVLPRRLGVIHPRYATPHLALWTLGVIALIAIAIVVVFRIDPIQVFAVFGGAGILSYQMMVFLVSLSIVVFFARDRRGESIWKAIIAPLLSTVLFGILIIFSAAQFEWLAGKPSVLTPYVIGLYLAIFGFGILYALWAKWRKPDVYRRIGRAVE